LKGVVVSRIIALRLNHAKELPKQGYVDRRHFFSFRTPFLFLPLFSLDAHRLERRFYLNGDFFVDELDAETLGDNMGMSNPKWADGDLDGDGDVDAADAGLLFAQFGLALVAMI
jgi:hypothetical protein